MVKDKTHCIQASAHNYYTEAAVDSSMDLACSSKPSSSGAHDSSKGISGNRKRGLGYGTRSIFSLLDTSDTG